MRRDLKKMTDVSNVERLTEVSQAEVKNYIKKLRYETNKIKKKRQKGETDRGLSSRALLEK